MGCAGGGYINPPWPRFLILLVTSLECSISKGLDIEPMVLRWLCSVLETKHRVSLCAPPIPCLENQSGLRHVFFDAAAKL